MLALRAAAENTRGVSKSHRYMQRPPRTSYRTRDTRVQDSAARTPKRPSCRFGIARTASAEDSSVPASHPPPRGSHAPARSARLDLTSDVPDGSVRSERKSSSFNWSNSTRYHTPAPRSGCAPMIAQGADPRRLCMQIVWYATWTGITRCARAWRINTSDTTSQRSMTRSSRGTLQGAVRG